MNLPQIRGAGQVLRHYPPMGYRSIVGTRWRLHRRDTPFGCRFRTNLTIYRGSVNSSQSGGRVSRAAQTEAVSVENGLGESTMFIMTAGDAAL